MKKLLCISALIFGIFAIQGCSSGPEAEAETTSPEASSQYETAAGTAEAGSSSNAPAATAAPEAEAGE